MKIIRLLRYGVSVTASYLAGLVGSFLVWNFIYSIGARVITDEMYANLHDTVVYWGGVIGAFIGLSTVLLLRKPALILLGMAHALATLAGCIGGGVGWREGLYAYFGGLTIFLGGVLLRGLCAWADRPFTPKARSKNLVSSFCRRRYRVQGGSAATRPCSKGDSEVEVEDVK